MSDFENRVRTLLVESVDQTAGPQRPAPSFDPAAVSTTGRGAGRRPWVTPLLAAACVAVIAGATAVVVGLLTHAPTVGPRPVHPGVVATDKVAIRPVTPDGRIAAGYSAQNDSVGSGFTCTASSRDAIDPGIAACGFFGSTGTQACWRSIDPKYVLCLPDTQSRVLYRLRITGRFPTAQPPRQPTPLEIVLTDGDTCSAPANDTGNLTLHPDWELKFSCHSGAMVFAPDSADGVDRAHRSWTVQVFRNLSDHGTVRAVRTAYFAGTA